MAQLHKPRPGVGDVVRAHFRLQRHRVMRQVLRWVEEARDATIKKRMADAAVELGALLAALAAESGAN